MNIRLNINLLWVLVVFLLLTVSNLTYANNKCHTRLKVLRGLQPGDTLAPYVAITKEGNPIVNTTLLISGEPKSSVIWDGRETKVDLQVSCDGKVETYSVVVPAFSPPAPTSDTHPECTAEIGWQQQNIKPGDQLNPVATVTSVDGNPVQGQIHQSWYINGKSTPFVAWDGKETRIELQLSCQGHAQIFTVLLPAYLPEPPPTVTEQPPAATEPPPAISEQPPAATEPPPAISEQPPAVPEPRLDTDLPELSGIGAIPGPNSAIEAIVGVLAPGLIGVLGGVLGGVFGNPLPGPSSASQPPSDGDPNSTPGRPSPSVPEDTLPPDIEYTYPDGRNTVLVYHPEQGGYIVRDTGGLVYPDDIEGWKRQNEEIQRNKNEYRQRNAELDATHQDSMSLAIQAIKDQAAARDKLQQNLSTMERGVMFGGGAAAGLFKPSGEPGNILDRIDELRTELGKGQAFDKDKYDRIAKVYQDAQAGKTLQQSDLPTSDSLARDIISDTIINTVGEVATGQKADGSISWFGMGARMLSAAMTAGSSEVALTPAAALYSMKTYVDKGGDSALDAFSESIKEVAIGEVYGAAGGYAMRAANSIGEFAGNTLSAVGKRVQGIIGKIEDSLSTGGTTVPRKLPASSVGKVVSAAEVAEAKAARAKARASQIGESRNQAGKVDYSYKVKPAPNVDISEHLKGMSRHQHIQVNNVAYKHNVVVDMRPTTKNAPDLIKRGIAEPKIPEVKSKTINKLDQYLGAPKDSEGFAGYFCPKKPDRLKLAKQGMSDAEVEEVLKRYRDRMQEYKDQWVHMRDLQRQGKVTVKDGLIYSKNGKPFTGDPDIFDIRDVSTGKPLPRYLVDPKGNYILNLDGTPKTNPAYGTPRLNPVREQIIKELQQPPLNAQHGTHMDWKYDNLSKKPLPDAPTGANSDHDMAKTIDNNVINKHRENGGGEPLLSFNGFGQATASWIDGNR